MGTAFDTNYDDYPATPNEILAAHSKQYATPVNNIEEGLAFGFDEDGASAADAYVVVPSPGAPDPLTKDYFIRLLISNPNTGASTLDVGTADGALAIKKHGGLALQYGDLPAGHVAFLYFDGTDWELANPAIPVTGNLFFGDGSDGNATITGGTTTLTADKVYENLTVEASGILETDGWRVFVRNKCQVDGTIRNNGSDGSGSSGGAAAPQGLTLGVIAAGEAGADGTTGVGNNATAGNGNETGGSGGDGGAGASGAGGTGTAASLNVLYGTQLDGFACVLPSQRQPGGGGGGGGGDGVNAGGGGGGGGGFVQILGRYIFGSGSIEALGGDGAAGTGGNSGGGGGGGGGAIYTLSINDVTGTSLTFDVSGGGGGALSGTGANGSDGGDGNTYLLGGR